MRLKEIFFAKKAGGDTQAFLLFSSRSVTTNGYRPAKTDRQRLRVKEIRFWGEMGERLDETATNSDNEVKLA